MPQFDEQSARRIARTVRESERRLRGRRPKRARWHGKGGGGAGIIRFKVLSAGPFLGDTALECDYVVAEVLGISCKGAGVSVGDQVNVWDPSECHFNIPLEVLVGTHGMAAKMVNDTEGVDCLDTRLAEGSCRWVVQTLCCVEEIYGS
jgi:hypothetical protein